MISTLFWFFGILGAISFAICTLPQVIKTYKSKSSKDISFLFILLSLSGNIFYGAYLFFMNLGKTFVENLPIYGNYGIALTLVTILLILKIKYK